MKIIRIFLIILVGIMIFRLGLRLVPHTSAIPSTVLLRNSPKMILKPEITDSGSDNFVLPGGAKVSLVSEDVSTILKERVKTFKSDTGKITSQSFKDFGFATVQKPDSDLGILIVCRSSKDPKKNVVYEYPSAKAFVNGFHFKNEMNFIQKRGDIPYFPKSNCEMLLQPTQNSFIARFYSSALPETIAAFYNLEMAQLGWELKNRDKRKMTKVYRKSNTICILDISINKTKDGTDIGFIVMTENQ